MALGDPYATKGELKGRLRIGDTDDDGLLDAALDVASRGIEACCHRQFNDAGSASARLFYPDSVCGTKVDDFSTTTGLVIETDASGTGVFGTAWTTAEYELAPLGGIVGGVSGWPYWKIKPVGRQLPATRRRAPLRVTARWGWTAIPTPIKEATLILAEDVFKLKDSPFGAGGYADYGRIRARENPNVWLRISPYVRDAVLVA